MVYGSLVLLELWIPTFLLWMKTDFFSSFRQAQLSAGMTDGRVRSCKLSFYQAQLSAGMADGRVRLCKLSFCQAQLSAGMADGRVGLCILSFCKAELSMILRGKC